jgi:hypothetical protein
MRPHAHMHELLVTNGPCDIGIKHMRHTHAGLSFKAFGRSS